MVKRLYKRFLEWALAPVLDPVIESVECAHVDSAGYCAEISALEAELESIAADVQTLRMSAAFTE